MCSKSRQFNDLYAAFMLTDNVLGFIELGKLCIGTLTQSGLALVALRTTLRRRIVDQ